MTTTVTIAARASASSNVKLHFASASDERSLKVLCATDLWALSDHAVHRTLSLAEGADAEAMLLHVVDEETPLRIIGRRADRAHSALRWRVRQLRPQGAPAAISVRVGNPRNTIVRVAKDWNADLMVLGSYRSRTADWLLGTSAERFVIGANCPALVVNREPAAAYSNLTLAAESLEDAVALARSVLDLGLAGASSSIRRIVLYSSGLRRPQSPSDSMRAELLGAGLGSDVEIVDCYGQPVQLVARMATQQGADLIVADLSRGPVLARALRRSMANTLMRSARCDVLIMPRVRYERCGCPARSAAAGEGRTVPRPLCAVHGQSAQRQPQGQCA